MANVQISGVKKRFGNAEVIHGLDIDVPDGSFVVLVGPSGCGKSTLLRMIAGLETISEGEISIGGKRMNGIPPKGRDIAMVFQSYALYPHMTVSENMGFSLNLKKMAKEKISQKVSKGAETLGLDQLLDRYPKQLSGGQRQRVATGRAIIRDPQVFLFDEPLSNLDAKLRVHMRAEIKELHQRLRTTTIYVTHDQVEAVTLGNIIVVLRDGRVEQMGKPLELYDRPANMFVASFIGSPSMNFLKGHLDASGNTVELSDGQAIMLDGSLSRADRNIVVGIRPENFKVTHDKAPGTLEFQVSVVEPTGADTVLIGKISGEAITATFRDRLTVEPGDQLFLKPTDGSLRLFDPTTEEAVS